MKINTSRKAGFTLVEIMIVVAIIGLLAAIAIPNFIRARKQSQTTTCLNNLRQIDSAKQQYALENGVTAATAITESMITPYLGRGAAGSVGNVVCPVATTKTLAGSYTIGNSETAPVCLKFNATEHNAVLN